MKILEYTSDRIPSLYLSQLLIIFLFENFLSESLVDNVELVVLGLSRLFVWAGGFAFFTLVCRPREPSWFDVPWCLLSRFFPLPIPLKLIIPNIKVTALRFTTAPFSLWTFEKMRCVICNVTWNPNKIMHVRLVWRLIFKLQNRRLKGKLLHCWL